MLYVKVDANGNPIEVAKNYSEIKKEYSSKNTAIPNESNFLANLPSFAYAEVPYSEPPKPKAGMKVVIDVPQKNPDGTMLRKWKEVAVINEEKIEMDSIMRTRRDQVLKTYIDSISPVRWNNMNDEDKAEVEAFYKSVLDMPEDPAWPFITFPLRPNCLR